MRSRATAALRSSFGFLMRPIVAAAAVAVVIVLPLLVVGEISDNEARARARAQMFETGSAVAASAVSELERYLLVTRGNLRSIATGDLRLAIRTGDVAGLYVAADRAATVAGQGRHGLPVVSRVAITDPRGVLLLEVSGADVNGCFEVISKSSSAKCEPATFAGRARGKNDPRAAELLARAPSASAMVRLSEPFVSDLGGEPRATVAIGALVTQSDADLRVIGLLLMEVDIGDAQSAAIQPAIEKAEDLYVVDRTGRYVTGSRADVEPLRDLSRSAFVARALRSQPIIPMSARVTLREDGMDPFTEAIRPFATAVMTNVVKGTAVSAGNVAQDQYGWQVLVVPDQIALRDAEATLAQLRVARVGLGLVLAAAAFLLTMAIRTIQRRRRELAESLEQQTATADVLGVISRSTVDLHAVFDAVVDKAWTLCRADHAWLWREVDGRPRVESYRGDSPVVLGRAGHVPFAELPRSSINARAYREKAPVHVPDLRAEPDAAGDLLRSVGAATALSVPLVREDRVLGILTLSRVAVRPFSPGEIALTKSFADQAVIAIENARLLDETREGLQRQTALREILQAISSSPTDLQPVFDTIARDAVRYCAAEDALVQLVEGTEYRVVAHAGPLPELETEEKLPERGRRRLDTQTLSARVIREARTLQVADLSSSAEYPVGAEWARAIGVKCFLIAPLLREGLAIGTIHLRRREAVPFTERQIQLLETFAAQAVIAIENVRLFTETQRKSAELEAASRHKSEFLANMSHELRTPLNAVIGFSDVLGSGMTGELSDKQSEYVRDISTSGRHLLDLVNEILDLSKVEAGRMELEPSEFTVSDTVLSTFDFVRERAARHGIELAADVPADLGTITADQRKVRQILLNLLSNAVKFTPDGGWVGVTARRADGEVTVSVRDTGIGIAPADQAKVFDEFRQVGKPNDRSREGTGLGLTLAKRFVELHGGRIWLESEVGKGTTFTFALPVAVRSSVDAAT